MSERKYRCFAFGWRRRGVGFSSSSDRSLIASSWPKRDLDLCDRSGYTEEGHFRATHRWPCVLRLLRRLGSGAGSSLTTSLA